MKGLLTWHGKIFRKTHNLVELGQSCVNLMPDFEPLFRRASSLSVYAWQYRYPGDMDEPDMQEAKDALNIAKETFSAVLAQLPPEVQP